MSEGRVARFRVKVHMDGKPEATVEIVEHAGGEDYTVSVRPLHSRMEYRANLSDVALIVQARHAKWLAQQQGITVPGPRKGKR